MTVQAVLDGPVLLRWPEEEDRRTELAWAGWPRLLVVEAGQPPPEVKDPLEDWIRAPADPVEVQNRLHTLQQRHDAARWSRPPGADTGSVHLDVDGIVRRGDHWVAVPPIEARLLAELLASGGAVVHRQELLACGWPAGPSNDHILDGRIRHLRKRLAPLGLAIRTARGIGFALVLAPGPTPTGAAP